MSNKFLLINKPSGPTSHDIIDKLRQITGVKKIGHAGTLDPFAQGLLLVAVGRESTKQLAKFVGLDKEYQATLKLGATSDTYDKTGNIYKKPAITENSEKTQSTQKSSESSVDDSAPSVIAGKTFKKEIEKILSRFIGSQEQLPPMFSAKKVKGKKLYEWARRGVEIERQPQKISIHKISLLSWSNVKGQMSIVINCTSGTYIRTLAYDIGQALGCGAYLEKLVRTKIGKYKIEDSVKIDELNKENWQEFCLRDI